jgi:hypothetical protein
MKIKPVKQVLLTEGEHDLIFRKWEQGKSKAGNPMLTLTFTPINNQPKIVDYFTYETYEGWTRLEAFLASVGVEIAENEEFEVTDLDILIGAQFRAKTWNENWEERLQTKIDEYLPAENGRDGEVTFDPETGIPMSQDRSELKARQSGG